MTLPAEERGSTLMLDEYFNAADARFVAELRTIASPKKLAGLAERWKKDPRPWARKQILAYLEQPLDCPGHQPLVKRLFKHAEARNDDELMAAFLVAFDRLVRRVRAKRWHFDPDTRESGQSEHLVTVRNTLPGKDTRPDKSVGPAGRRDTPVPRRRRGAMLFSYHTRYYVRRRAWRYFRRLGRKRPDNYPQAIARALHLYRDADLAKGENILDSWGLMHACFQTHGALTFSAAHVSLKDGRGLGELTPAPYCLDAWKKPAAAQILMALLTGAGARLVRVFAMQLLRREHKEQLGAMSADELLRLLDHEDEEVQQFGAELLLAAQGLAKLPVATWLRLLQTKNLTALQTVCDCFAKHVSAERLELAQCVEMACAQATAVSRLGLSFLKARKIETPEDRAAMAAVAAGRCSATAKDIAAWALGILGPREVYDRELVCRFFESLLAEMRLAAWEWLVADSAGKHERDVRGATGVSPVSGDPGLFARLLETPADDLRLRVVDLLQKRALAVGGTLLSRSVGVEALTPVWCAVLLSIHRGGRQKSKAIRQIGDAIRAEPKHAEALLPILSVALRSVRGSEARAALSAIVGAVEAHPQLAEKVQRHLPELKLGVPLEVVTS